MPRLRFLNIYEKITLTPHNDYVITMFSFMVFQSSRSACLCTRIYSPASTMNIRKRGATRLAIMSNNTAPNRLPLQATNQPQP